MSMIRQNKEFFIYAKKKCYKNKSRSDKDEEKALEYSEGKRHNLRMEWQCRSENKKV